MLPEDAPLRQEIYDMQVRDRKRILRYRRGICLLTVLFVGGVIGLSVAFHKQEQSIMQQARGNNNNNKKKEPYKPLQLDEALLVPHVIQDDLHIRRVCSPLQHSYLCLSVYYPTPQPLQNPDTTMVDPFDAKLYKNLHTHLLDFDALQACRADVVNDASIQACLQKYNRAHQLTALFTRTKRDGSTEWYHSGHNGHKPESLGALDGQLVLTTGNPLSAPHILQGLASLWSSCTHHGVLQGDDKASRQKAKAIVCTTQDTSSHEKELPHEGATSLALLDWELRHQHNDAHQVRGTTLQDELVAKNFHHHSITFVLDPPLPFNHQEMTNHPVQAHKVHNRELTRAFKTLHETIDELLLDATIVTFDSMPSWYATTTGATDNNTTECRAPLPPNSPLTHLNRQGGLLQEQPHLQTWEMVNLVATAWQHGSCQEAPTPLDAMYRIHKFVFLAWLEDDQQQQE